MSDTLGMIIKQRRLMSRLTVRDLAAAAGVSSSHLGRIERGERFPSAHILRKIAQPLDFQEGALLVYASYLSPPSASEGNREQQLGGLDTYVATVLAQESVEVQRAIIGILSMLRSLAKSIRE